MAIEDRMNTPVSVEYDAASDGSIVDAEGVPSPKWTPLIASVNCLYYEDLSRRMPSQEIGEDLTSTIFLFPAGTHIPRDETVRFGMDDVESGKRIYYYPDGKPTSPANKYVRVKARLGIIA